MNIYFAQPTSFQFCLVLRIVLKFWCIVCYACSYNYTEQQYPIMYTWICVCILRMYSRSHQAADASAIFEFLHPVM